MLFLFLSKSRHAGATPGHPRTPLIPISPYSRFQSFNMTQDYFHVNHMEAEIFLDTYLPVEDSPQPEVHFDDVKLTDPKYLVSRFAD